MSIKKQLKLLYFKDDNSELNSNTKTLLELFNTIDYAQSTGSVLKLAQENQYDLILGDLTHDIKRLDPLKKLMEENKELVIFTLVFAKDSDKFFGISELGINAVELEPSQFDDALGAIVDYLNEQK
jgi:response regulator RpfG family c-di-GMP phosphodiesterase